MKKVFLLAATIFVALTSNAQVVDNFNVGPYTVDYSSNGDVQYRLRDGINIYDYFELKNDTVFVKPVCKPLDKAIQVSATLGSSLRYAGTEITLEGVWKQGVAENIYVNAGLSLGFAITHKANVKDRTMFELGIPLQLEYGKLCPQSAGLYGSIGLIPAFYSTMNYKIGDGKGNMVDGDKKSGVYVAPIAEFGGNIPVGSQIVRIGLFGKFKVNCSKDNGLDVYKNDMCRSVIGGRIGLIF